MTFKMPFLKQFDAKTSIEQGRSMVEILGVLAVIGVLSACGIYGYIYAMKKYTANLLVQEAHLAYANQQGRESTEETNWIPVNFTPKCGYDMFTGKDEDGDTFVLVADVDKEMCQMLMQLGNNDALSFYQQVELEETNVALVTQCPTEPLDIIFAFEGTRAPGKDCETNDDCADSAGGYCHAETGTCYNCPDGKEPNVSHTFCNPICDTETESECWLDERRWCCGGNTICGETADECVESDGFCKYAFQNMDMQPKANCSYQISDEEMILSTNCSYNVSADIMTLKTNCAFKNGLASDGETLNMSVEGTPCPTGQYCYLSFKTSDCLSSVSATGAETIYGVCTDMNDVNASCLVQKATSGEMVTEDKDCPEGQYCYLSFSNNTCTGSASSNHAGKLYGVCTFMDNVNPSCSVNLPDGKEFVESITDNCLEGQYCYLSFTNETCSGSASSNYTGIIYGSCTDMDNTNSSCSMPIIDYDEMLSPETACPKQQYCYLAFKSKGCRDMADAKGSNPLWGVCLDMESVLGDLEECPIVE